MIPGNDNDDTRELIKKILNKKDPAIVGLKKILHGKSTTNPERSFTSHVPEVFKSTGEEILEQNDDSLFTENEKQIIEHEQEILELQNRIAELEANMEALKEDSFNRGKEQGAFEMQTAMQEQIEEHLTQLNESYSQQLSSVVAQQLKDREDHFQSIEPLVMQLSLQIARKIVDESLAVDQNIVESSIKKAIAHIAGRSAITVKVSPEDKEFMQERIALLCDNEDSIIEVRVESSPNIARGGCLIETDTGIIDATIDNQFEELQQKVTKAWSEYNQRDESEVDDEIAIESVVPMENVPQFTMTPPNFTVQNSMEQEDIPPTAYDSKEPETESVHEMSSFEEGDVSEEEALNPPMIDESTSDEFIEVTADKLSGGDLNPFTPFDESGSGLSPEEETGDTSLLMSAGSDMEEVLDGLAGDSELLIDESDTDLLLDDLEGESLEGLEENERPDQLY